MLCPNRTPLEDVHGDHLADLSDVCLSDEFQFDLAKAGEPQLQFTVQIQHTGAFDGVSLDLAVGQGSEVLLLAGETLDVDNDDPLIGEDHAVTDGLVGANDLLAGDEHGHDHVGIGGEIYRLQLQEICVLEIDHGKFSFVILFGVRIGHIQFLVWLLNIAIPYSIPEIRLVDNLEFGSGLT